jgi:hypothetical protein
MTDDDQTDGMENTDQFWKMLHEPVPAQETR